VSKVSDDHGLTLLKFWIAKLLALRVVIQNKSISHNYRNLFLKDGTRCFPQLFLMCLLNVISPAAIHTAHNIIVIHTALVRFPDAAFFVSPIVSPSFQTELPSTLITPFPFSRCTSAR
jgi:hypothetical protein